MRLSFRARSLRAGDRVANGLAGYSEVVRVGLTANQARAVRTMGVELCVDAGAGSGKTRVLIERVVHLLAGRRAHLDEIVAITFTRKAAGEMKERLRRAFRERAPSDDAGGMSYWRDLERRVDMARISTIHSFCAGVLRENALALGIDPDFRLLEESDSELLRVEVVEETLHRQLAAGRFYPG